MKPNPQLPVRFFERELRGEEPPSFLTMKALYDSAMDLFARQPWVRLTEDELVLVETAKSTELCFCSIMGALGEVRSLYVYIGPEAFQTFQKLQQGKTMTVGEFYAGLKGVSVEFVRPSELTPPDRAALKACGYPFKRGILAPIFRASRPGYHPWYVTEGEAQILDECQRAAAKMCDLVKAHPEQTYWSKEGVYPLFSFQGDGGEDDHFRIRTQEVPRDSRSAAEPASLDQSRIERVRNSNYLPRGVLEVDHFYGPGMIGKKNERRACFRMGLAVDAETGHAYPPEANMPEPSTGDVLAGVVLNAIEDACARPAEVRVRDGEFKVLLDPLAQALGFRVKIARSLPALDFAKGELLKMMGDPGPMPPWKD